MLWTGPRRVDSLFFVQSPLARRVTRQRLSSVILLVMTDYDEDKIDEAVLALLYLGLHDVNEYGGRAWKGFDWSAMNRLHAKGLISDPRSAAKSVVLEPADIAAAGAQIQKVIQQSRITNRCCGRTRVAAVVFRSRTIPGASRCPPQSIIRYAASHLETRRPGSGGAVAANVVDPRLRGASLHGPHL